MHLVDTLSIQLKENMPKYVCVFLRYFVITFHDKINFNNVWKF